jgi:hypothetical protein
MESEVGRKGMMPDSMFSKEMSSSNQCRLQCKKRICDFNKNVEGNCRFRQAIERVYVHIPLCISCA